MLRVVNFRLALLSITKYSLILERVSYTWYEINQSALFAVKLLGM